ncbi:FAS1 domain-containing protein [Immersiella caudata]|uniref:FAS1 domain-containing protein n=1 Tax=Immersiella caudata TaxID=314043 RepID=A0AA39WYP4_9PEZI|nr:FAS1 domain-containing protein [Immersiella caudata]
MHTKRFLLPLAAATAAWAQSLTDVLASQNHTLSTLIGLIQQQPDLLRTLGSLTDITILAPSNEAFTKLLSDPAVAAAIQSTPSLVPALLTYHVLNGTFLASALTALSEPAFVHTFLTDTTYSTVSGGQVVEVKAENGGVTVLSGNGASAKVTATDINFTGGTIHIIDNVLSIPPNLTVALTQGNLTALAGAATQANLVQAVSDIQQLTLFAPNNEAFAAAADVAAGLTVEQLTAVLGYHVIDGTVVYSSNIVNGTKVQTLQGSDLTITIRDGGVYVNDAKVVKPDVLVKNGVVHVIDGILIPDNLSSATPSASGTATGTGAAATGTATVVPGMGSTMGKGAVGAVALFGSVAALMNM